MLGRLLTAVVVFGLTASLPPQAQTPPTPGPEAQALSVWVGTWQGQLDTKAGPMGPAETTTLNMTCEWFTGNFQVVCHGETTAPKGKTTGLTIAAYDKQSKSYKWFDINSDGEVAEPAVTVSGNAWIFTYDLMPQGKPGKFRLTTDFSSATSTIVKAEMSTDGNTWTVVGEGKGKKIK